MSKLDDIFDQYRQDCFLAQDVGLTNDHSVSMLAYSGVNSKQQIKDLMIEIKKESYETEIEGQWSINPDLFDQKVNEL